MDLIGIENEGEFFPAGALSEGLQDELREISGRWTAELGSQNPVERLKRSGGSYLAVLRQIENTTEEDRRQALRNDGNHMLVTALGYEWQRDAFATALAGETLVPVIGRAVNADGRDIVWLIEAPLAAAVDEATDALSKRFEPGQFSDEDQALAELEKTIAEILAAGIFGLRTGPRFVLVIDLAQIVLVDRNRWSSRAVLRFDLREIFQRVDTDTLLTMACLVSREARAPVTGIPIADRLEEEAQRNANSVTSSLKATVRDAIELLGQEVLNVTGGKYPTGPRRGTWIDGPELSIECLRYMYRLLFLFYAEANPRLGILDLRDPVYASGYSLEALRELESRRLPSPQDKEGTFLWESLQLTLSMIYDGRGGSLKLPAVKVSLLDPESTPILNSVKLRNAAIQQILRLLSLKRTRSGTSRISYAKLGIGQLGAVYETLISFTGVVAKDDLIELKIKTTSPGDDEENASECAEDDGDVGQDTDAVEESRTDKIDLLAPSYFVPKHRAAEFSPEQIVFDGPTVHIYPKGSFIYRLAGRDREKSASYYTPEPLARLLVKNALLERCKDMPADEILNLKILEPAMGSAAFLVETANQLADLYLERKQREVGRTILQEEVLLERQKVRSFIADRNCFGVDLNPIAVELGAISLWLNSLHRGAFSPWFGDQLHAGNSLLGARRDAYHPRFLTAKKKTELWYNEPPTEIGWKSSRPEGYVWQFLLPAEGMASFDKERSIAEFAGKDQQKIKEWRRGGFFDKLEPHEVSHVQRLSAIVDQLFDEVTDSLKKSRASTNDAITLWPNMEMSGTKGETFHEKQKRLEKITGLDHAANTLPYKRLKTAMDAWCALWLWPLNKAHLLPSRSEFLNGMAMILEGGFSTDGSLAAPSATEFGAPQFEMFGSLNGDQVGAVTKYSKPAQPTLFRETNVEALVETSPWLGVATRVADQEHFAHFDLIFADVMRARGGFDLIVGNPPWAKPTFDEALAVSVFDPAVGAKGLRAKDVREGLADFINTPSKLEVFLSSFVIESGRIAFTSSNVQFPSLGSGGNNLYACFLVLAWRLVSPEGIAGLVHQDRHLSDPKDQGFRKKWYSRIRRHFAFRNELKNRNFSDIGNRKEFSLNIYGAPQVDVGFFHVSGLLDASQVEESFSHDGTGPIPPLKDEKGNWLIRGHRHRIIWIDQNALLGMAEKTSELVALVTPKFPQIYSLEISKLFLLLGNVKKDISLITLTLERPIVETDALKDGSVVKRETYVSEVGTAVLTAPMIKVGSAFAQCPGRYLRSHRDYQTLDFQSVQSIVSIRFGYKKLQANIVPAANGRSDDRINAGETLYSLAARDFIDVNGERSLIAGLVPSGLPHLHTVRVAKANSQCETLSVAAQLISLPFDFLLRTAAPGHLDISVLSGLPYRRCGDDVLSRALLLFCHLSEFSPLWNSIAPTLSWSGWSQVDPRLPSVEL